MICLLDGLTCTRECDVCKVKEIKETKCILDGFPCEKCGRCDEIADGG